MGLITLLIMSALLGAGSFASGMVPLSFTFSKTHLARLSTLGTGLLLGAALGVIIPEGIETIAASHPTSELPTSKIALSLLLGFTFMLILEQLVSPHSHTHGTPPPLHAAKQGEGSPEVHFDAELGELESSQGMGRPGFLQVDTPTVPDFADSKKSAYPLTLGLVMHALADGLALGVSALSDSTSSDLSLVVFLALIIHKAPTALALTTSLLTTTISRAECRKHLAVFSASTPLGAIVSYVLFSSLGAGGGHSDWTGIALLVSGGTFLYVATVLQSVSHHRSSDDMRDSSRVALIAIGMFIPFGIGALVGHGHDHAPTPSP